MARKALEVKCKRNTEKATRLFLSGKKIKFATKLYHRCSICGRVRGYYGKFDMCRICIRERANSGELIGVRKSSW
ncbi:MAG: type Z 30S ribosomal protein S14 [Candidatus Gracilibacteria bacterium]|nr:type Z 30S ribosomal protein S14 [Candidatus Gracilibacteria bacterium]MDD2908853.1 type Z 30S ribosomal protein S14 [Candidatus Gracilibacteria bacterium]